jgi:hypothetical protein
MEYKQSGASGMTERSKQPVMLYLSYSQKDEALKQEFEDYLVNSQQARIISGWTERQVQPGADWSEVIDPRLAEARIFLVLLSPSTLPLVIVLALNSAEHSR